MQTKSLLRNGINQEKIKFLCSQNTGSKKSPFANWPMGIFLFIKSDEVEKIFYTKWIYDLGSRCEVIFYQGDLRKSLRSIAYGIIF